MAQAEARRITGRHLLLDGPGAALELSFGPEESVDLGRLRARVRGALGALGLDAPLVERAHAGGLTVAVAAPLDLALAAAEALEWAAGPGAGDEAPPDELVKAGEEAASPRLRALLARFPGRAFADDDGLTLGLGRSARTWPLDRLPADEDLGEPGRVPVVLITGTNGKTTTARMVARIAAAAGLCPGMTSSDGITVGERTLEVGDWTGPGAARQVLRDPRVEFAALETARGGLMRRGLALEGVDAAVVTNVSDDHLGEWGLDDVDALREAKLVVARAVRADGVVVLGERAVSDDALPALRAALAPRRVWRFGDQPGDHLEGRCEGDELVICQNGITIRIPLREIPATAGGAARHNVENALAAGLLALAAGLPPAAVEAGLRAFRPSVAESRGRLNRFRLPGGGEAIVDFAHNPDGLRALAGVVARRAGRLIAVLGQAGDRTDRLIAAFAAAALALHPDRVVLKELPEHLRGRAPGEVPAMLRAALVAGGVADDAIEFVPDEVDAVRAAVALAGPGDLALLPVHERLDEVLVALAALGAEPVG